MKHHAMPVSAGLLAFAVTAGYLVIDAPTAGASVDASAVAPAIAQPAKRAAVHPLPAPTATEIATAFVRSSLVAKATTPQAKTKLRASTPSISVKSGPSPWRGKTIPHPDGGNLPRSVTRWANVVLAVMDELNIPYKYLPGILAQMLQESDGNPQAINLTDSNAAMGIPSQGLLQVVPPTYRTFAKPGYRSTKYIQVPYTNIYAALRYVKSDYGMYKFRSWNDGANQAY